MEENVREKKEGTLVVCKSPKCKKEFVAPKDWSLYCCRACGNAVRQHRFYHRKVRRLKRQESEKI